MGGGALGPGLRDRDIAVLTRMPLLFPDSIENRGEMVSGPGLSAGSGMRDVLIVDCSPLSTNGLTGFPFTSTGIL